MITLPFVLLAGLTPLPLNSGSQQSVTTAIKDVRIFNGEEIIPSGTVIIEGGQIRHVGKAVSIPKGTRIVNGKGHTLLPGLFDCHVHVWAEQNLKQSLIFGVTTVVDMFMNVETMIEIKKSQADQNVPDSAFLISPGTLTTAPGGHGTQYGMPIPTIDDPADAQAFVDARIKEGADFIKIIWDDGSSYGRPIPTLDKETVQAVIEAAHKRDKKAIIHAGTLEQCLFAMEAGVDGLAHLFFNNRYDPDFGRLASRKKTFVIPIEKFIVKAKKVFKISICLCLHLVKHHLITHSSLYFLALPFDLDTGYFSLFILSF